MPMLVQQGRGCMAKLVGRNIFRESGCLNRVFDNDLDSPCGESNPSVADEKRVIFWIIVATLNKLSPHFLF